MIIINSLLPISFPMPLKLSSSMKVFDVDRDNATRVRFQDTKINQANRTIGGFVVSHWGDNLQIMSVEGSVLIMPGQEALGFLSLLILRSLYKLDKKTLIKLAGIPGQLIYAGLVTATAIGEYQKRLTELTSIKQSSAVATAETVANNILAGSQLIGLEEFINKRDSRSLNIQDLANTYIYHDNYLYSGYFTQFQYTRDVQNYRKISYSFNFTVDSSTEATAMETLVNSGNLARIIT